MHLITAVTLDLPLRSTMPQPIQQHMDQISFGTDADDVLFGSDGSDLLDGQAGADILMGGRDADWLLGGTGDDWLFGGHDDDTLSGEGGDDNLFGGHGNDYIVGGDGNDHLFGQHGRDRLFGREGDDILEGGRGDDLLNGGEGFDRFFWARPHLGGSDIIEDFTLGEDRLILSISSRWDRHTAQLPRVIVNQDQEDTHLQILLAQSDTVLQTIVLRGTIFWQDPVISSDEAIRSLIEHAVISIY